MSQINLSSGNMTLVLLLALVVIAAVPRFYNLGNLGFYGDEETTSFPSRAVAQNQDPVMPSGMPYRRALPHTWANALVTKVFGQDNEISYRIVSALLGTLTIPLIFFLARPYVGVAVAVLAALLLALSEWHILTSREARMYAPFMFFYIAAGFTLWNWLGSGNKKYFWLSLVFLIITISLHTLSIFLVGFLIIPFLLRNWSNIPIKHVFSFILGTAVFSHLYTRFFVSASYGQWKLEQGTNYEPPVSQPVGNDGNVNLAELFQSITNLDYALLITSIFLTLWFIHSQYQNRENLAISIQDIVEYALAGFAIVLLCTGNLHAALISLLLYLFSTSKQITTIAIESKKPLIIILLVTLGASLINVYQFGIIGGIKQLLAMPYPYISYLAALSPVLFLLFIVAIVMLFFRPKNNSNTSTKAIVIITILPITAMGIATKWGGIRFIIEAYPFFLLIASFGFVNLVRLILDTFSLSRQTKNISMSFSIAVFALSGVSMGHGIPQSITIANMGYGKAADSLSLGFESYPDHRGAGSFVRKHLQADDIVVAEDMLQQKWYVDQVDYWLRDSSAAAGFLYQDRTGEIRDIYVNSIAMTDETMRAVSNIKNRRIWVITSGETFFDRASSLSDPQLEWLTQLEARLSPVYTGKDKITMVYCVNCTPTQK